MKFGNVRIPNIPPRWSFLLPLLSASLWWAMLIAMLVCWIVQGRPLYQSDHYYMIHTIVYLSYVGATNLQPLFIVGTVMMGIFFVWTMMQEFYLRSNNKQFLLISFENRTRNLHIAIIIFSIISSCSIILVACLKDTKFDTAHLTFVGVFIISDLILVSLNISLYFIYNKYYKKSWFFRSALLKLIWLIIAIGLAIGYVVLMELSNGSNDKRWGYSGILEWSLCFWFGLLFFFFAFDLSLNKNLKDDVVNVNIGLTMFDSINHKKHYPKYIIILCSILFIQFIILQVQSIDSVKEIDNEQFLRQNKVGDNEANILPPTTNTNTNTNTNANTITEKKPFKYSLINELFEILIETKPQILPLKKYKNDIKAKQKFATDDDFYFSESYLSSLLDINDDDIIELKSKHELFIKSISNLNMEIFGDEKIQEIKGDGIVIVGGGKFTWLALLNIHQLRSTGCTLPVEVFLPIEVDYEPEFCNEILPKLNAKCTLGFKSLPMKEYTNKLDIGGFQYKILAILISSFENVLLLDSDNVVKKNPINLFNWQKFKNLGLIIWPDCWSRTTNPAFYKIADIIVGSKPIRGIFKDNLDKDEWNYHDLQGTLPNPSSESGMILVNKISQVDTLLLSLYYNIYGPDYYYPLITQGGAGEGDKDTFIAAAYALSQPVYQVEKTMSFIGIHNSNGFHSKALGQWDPIDDDSLLFIHMSYPKLYPDQLNGEIIYESGEHHILYSGGDVNKLYSFDLRMWELITQLLCVDFKDNEIDNLSSVKLNDVDKLSGLKLNYINELDIDLLCDDIHLPHLKYLRNLEAKEQ
ncbi:hypothetical protein CANARDRAFT_19955 [[Candida] arabinofermentans NRRL YB-2248]|uniref:CWH43-like N-terminal domain-containing protein n=1 Tax=[Candida] arabinofermentans NRRL YB-2248 TaxID=983967 RepID=A0A1E4SU33_9ASCO|nr:hypothetical protein CANARDRAFT_19955 [[Candida] arabinofermentans NRRL YB-2248]